MERICAEPELIQRCVERVLDSDCFGRSPQARRFLQFVSDQAQQGGGEALKAYTIGVQALGVQNERSCPETTARMQASRVRRLLSKFYQTEGREERVVLQLPSGSYEPRFVYRAADETAGAELPRIYVDDLESLSSNQEEQRLCRGLTDAVVGFLVQCPHLKVVRGRVQTQRGSGFSFSGSVLTFSDRLRLSVQCLDVATGETVWSEHLDRDLVQGEVVSVQDWLALWAACRIGDPSLGIVARALRHQSLTDPVQRAMHAFYALLRAPSFAQLRSARTSLEECLPHAQGAALVHAAYACVLAVGVIFRQDASKNQLASAEAHARLCVSRDSSCALGHLAKALIHYEHRERACVQRELARAQELCGADGLSRALCGLLFCLLGDFEPGLAQLDQARLLLPELPSYLLTAPFLYHFFERGDSQRALEYAEQIDIEDAPWGDVFTAASYGRGGRLVEARRMAGRISSMSPHLAKKLPKLLAELLFLPEMAEALRGALADAGVLVTPKGRTDRAVFRAGQHRELPSEIRVGILQSLSGTMALSETHLVNAAMLAIDEINRAGGVLGRPVHAVVEDGASDASLFGLKAERLLKDHKVTSIFGCWTSSSRKAVLPLVERHDALLWYPLQYEGLETSRNVIYTGSCLNQQIEPAVRWAQKQQKNSCYLVGSDYVFPRTANRLIRALVESSGGTVLGSAYEPLGAGRFDLVAAEIARLKPDIVYNTVNGADNVALLEALQRAGVQARTTVMMSFSLSELELGRCAEAARGHLSCWSYFQSMDSAKNRELLARFRGRYGVAEVLSDPAVTAYSQVHLWKDVVERAGTLETEAVLRHLSGSKMALGDDELEVLANHHVQRRAIIGRASGQQFQVIWTSPKLIEPQPWLGVESTDLLSRDLVLGALKALPEMAAQGSFPMSQG